MTASLHPDDALFDEGIRLPDLPSCEHYAGNEKLMRKAMALQAERGPVFDITFDCDDGAPRGGEREHAQMVAELVASADNAHGRIGVRIHDLVSPHWEHDVETLIAGAGARLAYVTLPKTESAAQVLRLNARLQQLLRGQGIERRLPIQVLAETHAGLRSIWEICAVPEVEVATLGPIDLFASFQGAVPAAAARSPLQFEHGLAIHAKAQLSLAALGNGALPAHGVTIELKNAALTRADARRARQQFGYLRQVSVHPIQIDPIVQAMRPDVDEVTRASEVMLLARDANWGPLSHGGQFEDRATYRHHWAVLRRANSTGAELSPDVKQAFFANAE